MGTATGKRYITIRPGERLDNLAQRVYGDPRKYTLLIQANPTLSLFRPLAGQTIEVPDAK